MSEWQPIDSAPKDGTRILLLRKGRVVVGNWNADARARKPQPYWDHDLRPLYSAFEARRNTPSHWMPLPKLPMSA